MPTATKNRREAAFTPPTPAKDLEDPFADVEQEMSNTVTELANEPASETKELAVPVITMDGFKFSSEDLDFPWRSDARLIQQWGIFIIARSIKERGRKPAIGIECFVEPDALNYTQVEKYLRFGFRFELARVIRSIEEGVMPEGQRDLNALQNLKGWIDGVIGRLNAPRSCWQPRNIVTTFELLEGCPSTYIAEQRMLEQCRTMDRAADALVEAAKLEGVKTIDEEYVDFIGSIVWRANPANTAAYVQKMNPRTY